jgi:hypothetical protein
MENDTMNVKTKISELSLFYSKEYIITDLSNNVEEIHGLFNSLSIDGNNIYSITINNERIQFILTDGTKFYINFKKLPIINYDSV